MHWYSGLLLCSFLSSLFATPIRFEADAPLRPPRQDEAVARFSADDALYPRRMVELGKPRHEFRSLFTCDLCKTATYFIERVMRWTRDKATLVSRAKFFCKVFRFEEDDICDSIVPLYADMVIEVARNTSLSGDQICGLVFGSTCAEAPAVQWHVNIPSTPSKPPVVPLRPPPKGAPVKRILHISDTHIDFEYRAGSNADCARPLCCRAGDGAAPDAASAAGQWGSNLKCDTPPATFQHLLKTLKQQEAKEGKFDYIYWTGDIPAHNVWNQSRADQLTVIQRVADLLTRAFPDTPIFPSLGNHEASPANSFPPRNYDGRHSMAWLYDKLEANWKRWLPKGAYSPSTIRFGGFYSALVEPGFRVISLNMNYCNNHNFWLLLNTTDPLGHLQWLVRELFQAEAKGEKVHILGHIPPGTTDCLKSWSFNFYDVVSRFEATITGQFFGHTHYDEFQVFYDNVTLKRPLNVAYVAPSVTTFSYLNPAYRVYLVDGDRPDSTRYVLDSTTFFLNVSKANLENRPQWEREYSAREAFNMTSLFPADWDSLSRRMAEDRTLFERYVRFFYSSYAGHEADTEEDILCRTVTARSDDPALCRDILRAFRKARRPHPRRRARRSLGGRKPCGAVDPECRFAVNKPVRKLC